MTFCICNSAVQSYDIALRIVHNMYRIVNVQKTGFCIPRALDNLYSIIMFVFVRTDYFLSL